jgi:hypothetical protein
MRNHPIAMTSVSVVKAGPRNDFTTTNVVDGLGQQQPQRDRRVDHARERPQQARPNEELPQVGMLCSGLVERAEVARELLGQRATDAH